MHWWAVVEAIDNRRDSVPLVDTCLDGHRLLFRFEGVVPSHPSVELAATLEILEGVAGTAGQVAP